MVAYYTIFDDIKWSGNSSSEPTFLLGREHIEEEGTPGKGPVIGKKDFEEFKKDHLVDEVDQIDAVEHNSR